MVTKENKEKQQTKEQKVKELKSVQPLLTGSDTMLVPTKNIGGQYTNRLSCTHNEDKEFILDFASLLPGMELPRVHSRIIISSEKMKSFIDIMTSSYNKVYGKTTTKSTTKINRVSKK